MDEFMAGNFLYLRPRQGMDRNAYDLETCEHWETDPNDYYTMSKAGITHFVGTDSEFTTLEQWEREYSLFSLIRAIPFFAKYCKWKNFTVWKRNVRAKKASMCSQVTQPNPTTHCPSPPLPSRLLTPPPPSPIPYPFRCLTLVSSS